MKWEYFNKFEGINDKYLSLYGEGETAATQIVTAVNKLVYRWYNDGDVFDNTTYLTGWCNDLSSYANWLHVNTGASKILEGVFLCKSADEYEDLLIKLADELLNEEYLAAMDKYPKRGSVYECDGPFEFIMPEEDDDYDEEYW